MKKVFTLFPLLFIITISYSQNTAQFKESQYLKIDSNGFFVTVIGDSIKLKIKKDNGYKMETTGISISNGDTIIHQSKIKKNKYVNFIADDFGLKKQNRLYGDFVQDKNVLKFYPWTFNKNSSIESKLKKNDYYIIEIPNRVVVKTNYSAWHYGALTLPVKFYTSSVDSISNTQFGVNINLMIGRKWGKKKYSNLDGNTTTPYTIAKSINLIVGMGELKLSPSNTEMNLTTDISVAYLSYGFAFGFQYKKIGIFVASGFDTPLSTYGEKWIYKERLWLGFGLGLGI